MTTVSRRTPPPTRRLRPQPRNSIGTSAFAFVAGVSLIAATGVGPSYADPAHRGQVLDSGQPAAAGQRATAEQTLTLRPKADLKPFTVARASSAAAAIDDPVLASQAVRAGDAIIGRERTTTSVRLRSARVDRKKLKASKAWVHVETALGARLRIEVTSSGRVLGATTVGTDAAAGWRSISFTPTSQGEVDGLELRFVAIGSGDSTVRAAYAGVVSGSRTLVLRPESDVAGMRRYNAARSYDAIDDGVMQPAATDRAYLGALRGGSSTSVSLDAASSSTWDPQRGTVWFKASTGSGSTLVTELVTDGIIRARATLKAKKAAAWRSISYRPSSAELSGASLRLTTTGAAAVRVDAVYFEVSARNRNRVAVDHYLNGLDDITASDDVTDRVTGRDPDTTQILPDASTKTGQLRYNCRTTLKDVSTSPESIVVMSPDVNKLWLGSLLQGRGYQLGIGSLQELPIRDRTPLTVYMDVLGQKKVSTRVERPDAASMQQAISDLVGRAVAEKIPFPYRADFRQLESSSTAEAMLKMKVSVKYLGASLTASLDTQRDASEHTVVAQFVQRMFSVAIVTPATPSGYFSDDFTADDLRDQIDQGSIGPDNQPVVITHIDFGRRLTYSVTAKASSSEIRGAIDAAYSGGAVSGSIQLDARQKEIISSAEYHVLALGGDQADTEQLIKSRQLGDYFTGHSDPRTAVPISYQFDNVRSGSAAKFVDSTSYNLTECHAVPNRAIVDGALVDVVRQPTVYLNKGDTCAMYGSLALNGSTFWSRNRDARLQDLPLHTVRPLDGADLAPIVGVNGQYPMKIGQLLRLTGSINCSRWFGDPANVWKSGAADFVLPAGLRVGQTFEFVAVGGSPSTPVDVRLHVTVRDLTYRYET